MKLHVTEVIATYAVALKDKCSHRLKVMRAEGLCGNNSGEWKRGGTVFRVNLMDHRLSVSSTKVHTC